VMQELNESTVLTNIPDFDHLLGNNEIHTRILTLALHNFCCWAHNLLQIFLEEHSNENISLES